MAAICTILHPTDFSDSARTALRLAQRLARDHGARLIVLHVAAPPVTYGEMGVTFPLPEVREGLIERQRIQLEELVAGTCAECRAFEGVASHEIERIAREEPCDLIVMGTHGRGGVARALLGSVAVDVMRHAPCPVLVVKGHAAQERAGEDASAAGPGADDRPLFPVILHPTDFSECSRHAFDHACALARRGGRLIVQHVVEAVHIVSEGYEDALNERLRKLQPGDPQIQVDYRLCAGESAEEILREAAASSCDLIVLGTHGRTGLSRLIMGSVAEAVLRRADCPVLAVKAPTPSAGLDSPVATTTS
jgi:nucleotide-binding universal stress UspA family protein